MKDIKKIRKQFSEIGLRDSKSFKKVTSDLNFDFEYSKTYEEIKVTISNNTKIK